MFKLYYYLFGNWNKKLIKIKEGDFEVNKEECAKHLDDIINKRLDSLDEDIKYAVEVLMGIYAEKTLITRLKFLKEDILDLE